MSGTNQENEFELPAEVLEAIPEADLNGDGVVTIGELKLHLQGEEGPHRIQIRAVKKTGPGGEESDPEVTVVFESGDVSTILHEHPEADLDGDGVLSKQELHEFAQQAQPEGTKTRVRAIRVEHGEGSEEPFIVQLHGDGDYTAILERHPDADRDGDGALTREELLEWMKTQHEGEPVQFRLHSRALMLPHSEHGEEDVIVWHSKDGQIDVSGAGGENVFVRRVEPGEVDLDGNGLISEAELEAFRETCCPEAEGAGKVVIAIAPESGAWQVHASREEESGDRLGRLLEKYPDADLNGDGVLSKEEALALAARLQKEGRKQPPR